MATSWDYKKAGLDLEAYAQTMSGIQGLLQKTWDSRVIPPPFPPRTGGKGSGGFASLFDLNPILESTRSYQHPVMVTCTDGVGSKLKIATMMNKFDTVGIDLVAMSVNDLICTGGDPLVFLDYLAMPKDDTPLTTALVQGISDGCLEAGCSLVGGETAILPDIYGENEFDMAGFAAGVVERHRIIDGRAIRAGDVVLGLPSSGFHSNGYSLVRKVIESAGLTMNAEVSGLGSTLGDALLTPTRLYARPIQRLLKTLQTSDFAISGLANITGGGLIDNIARILPPDHRAVLKRPSWPVPHMMNWLQNLGGIAQSEMDRVFNNGIGFVIVCRSEVTSAIQDWFRSDNTACYRIGEIVAGPVGVEIMD